MHRTRSTLPLWILLGLVVGGLLLAGKGHAGIHDEDHGVECPACSLVGTTPPEPELVGAPTLRVTVRIFEPTGAPASPAPRAYEAPRGPPAVS